MGSTGTCHVYVDKYRNKNGGESENNKIRKFYEKDDQPAVSSAQQPQQAAYQQPYQQSYQQPAYQQPQQQQMYTPPQSTGYTPGNF